LKDLQDSLVVLLRDMLLKYNTKLVAAFKSQEYSGDFLLWLTRICGEFTIPQLVESLNSNPDALRWIVLSEFLETYTKQSVCDMFALFFS